MLSQGRASQGQEGGADHKEWFLTRVCLVGAFFSTLLAGIYALLESPVDLRAGLACSAVCLCTPVVWRLARGHPLVPQLALGLLTAIFTGVAISGALTYLAWLGLVTIVAFMLLGKRGGLGWMITVFALVGLTMAISSFSSSPAQLSNGTVLVRLLRVASLVPTLALTGYLFEQHRSNNIVHLETAVSARSRLLANVSHEMRTPLNGIIGLTQALQLERLPPHVTESLGIIQESGETLLALINELLDVARAEAGKVELTSGPFELTRLVERTAALHRARPEAKAIALDVKHRAEPLWVLGDSVRVQQVLGNLVANAIRHGAGSPVTVALSSVQEGEKVRAELRVIDHGPGLDLAQREQLFQPFVQLDPLTAPGGSGLGLYLSRSLARRLGGELVVEGTPGGGCTFVFSLLAEAAAAVSEVRPAMPRPFHGRVLVVDDNAINRKVASALLSKLGLQVDSTGSGEEALAWLGGSSVDLVLMDLQMPGLDGLETARRLRTLGFAAPIVALTASAQPETPGECAQAGMDGCLVKPLRLEQVVPLLERCLRPLRAA